MIDTDPIIYIHESDESWEAKALSDTRWSGFRSARRLSPLGWAVVAGLALAACGLVKLVEAYAR